MSFASVYPPDGSEVTSFHDQTIVLKARTAIQRAQLYLDGALHREYGKTFGGSLSSTGKTWTVTCAALDNGTHDFIAKYWGEGDTVAHEMSFTYTAVAKAVLEAPEDAEVMLSSSFGEASLLDWLDVPDGHKNKVIGYEVQRAERPCEIVWGTLGTWGEWEHLGVSADSGMYVYPPTFPGNQYRYRIRALAEAGEAFHSDWTIADGTLKRSNALKDLNVFTDPVLVPGETPVKAVHIYELWVWLLALRRYYDKPVRSIPDFEPEGLVKWKEHVEAIRALFDASDLWHIQWIEITDNCPRADVIQQIREALVYRPV